MLNMLRILLNKLVVWLIISLYFTLSNLIFLTLGWWLSETTEIFLNQLDTIVGGAILLSVGVTIIGTIALVIFLLGPTLYGVSVTPDLNVPSKIDREDITYPGTLILILFLGFMVTPLFGYLDGIPLREGFLKATLQALPFTLAGMLAPLGIVLTSIIILLSVKYFQTRLR